MRDGSVGRHVLDLRFLPQRVRDVTIANRFADESVELLARVARLHLYANPPEPEPLVLTMSTHREIRQLHPTLSGNMGDRQRKARRQRREKELGGHRAGICSAELDRLIGDQLEIAHRDAASKPTLPGGNNVQRR